MTQRNATLDAIRNYRPARTAADVERTQDSWNDDYPTARSERVETVDARMGSLREARGFRVEHPTVEINGWTVRQAASDLSEKQAKWIIDIATTREGVTPEMLASLRTRLEQGFAKAAASQFITKYKDMPRKQVAATKATAAEVPDGYYAIQLAGQDKPHFYRIKNGRKAGFVFVDEQVSDDRFPVQSASLRKQVLAEIAKDVNQAGLAYAALLGRCRRCTRTLTDHNNPYFAMGLGPECGRKA